MNGQITTARLPRDTRNKLVALSRIKGKPKSDIIKESLDLYYEQEENEMDSLTLGEPYFGNYSSGENDLSVTYKDRIKERIKTKLTDRKAPC